MHTPHRLAAALVAGLFVFCFGPVDGRAQEIGRLGNINASGVPYHVYAESGEATVRVYVVGGTAGGVYDLGAGTRFDQFLTLISVGPETVTSATREKTRVQLYRTDEAGARRVVLEGEAEELLAANPDEYPLLRDGDFVFVERRSRQRFGWRDALRIVTSVSSIIVLVERFRRL